jgi:hypothetical protein
MRDQIAILKRLKDQFAKYFSKQFAIFEKKIKGQFAIIKSLWGQIANSETYGRKKFQNPCF